MGEQNKTEALLPCPFCGASASGYAIEPHSHALSVGDWMMPDHKGSYVIEGDCACGSALIGETRAEVTARWNTRAAAPKVEPAQQATKQEAVAQAVYEQWSDRPNYRPWVAGGNSLKQDEARRIACAALAAQQAPAQPAGAVFEIGFGWLSKEFERLPNGTKLYLATPHPAAPAQPPAKVEREALTGWQPLSTAPVRTRVLLGPRTAPVVGMVHHMPEWADEQDSIAHVVHYNGDTLVAGYHCSEWHPLPAHTVGEKENGK